MNQRVLAWATISVLALCWRAVAADVATVATPHIGYVRPDRVRYRRKEPGTVECALANPTAGAFRGQLVLTVTKELADARVLEELTVTVAAKSEEVVRVPFRNDGADMGREVRAELKDATGQVLSSASEYFGVADDGFKVYVADTGYARTQAPGPFCHFPISWTPLVQKEWEAKNPYTYTNLFERFSWAPGEQMDLTPDTEIWWSGQSIYRGSKAAMRGMIEALQARGVTVLSYVNQGASGTAGFELYRQHPEWFRTPNQFDTEQLQTWDTKTFREAKSTWFAVWPDWTNKDARDYAINELIECKRMFGWDGFRWDCGQFEAPTHELNAEYLREMKKRVRAEFPDTVFGYNVELGGYGITANTDPDTYVADPDPALAELCKGGGLIMNEGTYAAYGKTHHLHKWADFAHFLCRMQVIVHRLGGYYNPFVLRRGGAQYDIDKRYETILQLAAGSHPYGIFYYHPFVTRYSAFLWDNKLTRMTAPDQLVQVHAPAELWWRPQANVRQLGRRRVQYIIHLVNPPFSEGVEENPEEKLRPPVADVRLTLEPPDGLRLRDAWQLDPDADPWAVQLASDGGAVALAHPVKFWNIVVAEFGR